ncbi:phospho-sugar mutase [Corynebacterium neomassiliense]|uniref:phospho-sugar mutase n=1 Tax=Corynebacterium neomassiliense TaxID=2079482 RepID=UPI001031F3D2|nr:phospho-sugar mutase [Corynebacterium neomassiliense]
MITFGTAGLRAPVGRGEDHMNVSTATRTTAGVARWLHGQGVTTPRVAVGFDSRYGSNAMARATAETFAGAGCEVTLLPLPTPTPVLAWLVRDRGLDAGVQITASHNPRGDNGYKLYLAGGSQLVSPSDREIEEAVAQTPPAPEIPRSPDVHLDVHAVDGYLTAIAGLVGSGDGAVLTARRNLRVLFTPLHGVGGTVLDDVFRMSGFRSPAAVPAQRWPDPEFPTVSFPNPEEPGSCDMLLETAAAAAPQERPDLLIALDPDADRCMVGIPDPEAPRGYRMLRGDETGPLLARHLVPVHRDDATPRPVVATTVVSSGLLRRIADASGWDFRETLTGFKYLARAAGDAPGDLVFACEEAIGTCPAPGTVADKDGVATALVTAVWAAELKARGRTLRDELADLDETFGVVRTSQVSVRLSGRSAAAALVAGWAASPPAELSAGRPATVEPLDPGAGTQAGFRVRWSAPTGGTAPGDNAAGTATLDYRVVVRPSGTEPKAKFYLQVAGPVPDGGADRRVDAEVVDEALAGLTATVRRLTAR